MAIQTAAQPSYLLTLPLAWWVLSLTTANHWEFGSQHIWVQINLLVRCTPNQLLVCMNAHLLITKDQPAVQYPTYPLNNQFFSLLIMRQNQLGNPYRKPGTKFVQLLVGYTRKIPLNSTLRGVFRECPAKHLRCAKSPQTCTHVHLLSKFIPPKVKNKHRPWKTPWLEVRRWSFPLKGPLAYLVNTGVPCTSHHPGVPDLSIAPAHHIAESSQSCNGQLEVKQKSGPGSSSPLLRGSSQDS